MKVLVYKYECICLFAAQTTCNQGMGRVMYERLPNQQLHGFDDDVVSKAANEFVVSGKIRFKINIIMSMQSYLRKNKLFSGNLLK